MQAEAGGNQAYGRVAAVQTVFGGGAAPAAGGASSDEAERLRKELETKVCPLLSDRSRLWSCIDLLPAE